MFIILRHITALIRDKPNAVLQATLPGLILFAVSFWFLRLFYWTSTGAYTSSIGGLGLSFLVVGSLVGIYLVGFLLLCVFVQRCLLRQADTPQHSAGKWAKAFGLYLLQFAALNAVLLCLAAILSYLLPAFMRLDVLSYMIVASLPAKLSETIPLGQLSMLIDHALSLLYLVPALWVTLRIGLTLTAAAMARFITPWASWRRTGHFQKDLWWLSLWVCVLFAATNAALVWQLNAPILASMPTGDAIEVAKHALSRIGDHHAAGVPYILLTLSVIRTVAFLLLFLCIAAAVYIMSGTKDAEP